MKHTLLFSLFFSSLCFSVPSVADPLLPAHSLNPAAERSLISEVRAARAAHPEVFVRVQHLRGLDPSVYHSTRLQRPSVARELVSLGPDALLPMLDALALSGYSSSLDADQRDALEVGLLHAISVLRDPRAEPGLRAAFISLSSRDAVRAAALGLGALCTDTELGFLSAEARRASPRRDAALEGIGACRSSASVRALASALDQSTEESAVIAAARGLASAGSSWAQAAQPTGEDLPRVATQALLRAFVRAQSAAREEVRLAVLSVGYAGSAQIVREAAAQSTDPALRQRLSALESTLRHSNISH